MMRRKVLAGSELSSSCSCNVTVYGLDQTADGQMIIVPAFHAGETLKDTISRSRMAITETLDAAIQIGRRGYRHSSVHRDVMPANILIGENNVVKILEFRLPGLMTLRTFPEVDVHKVRQRT